MKTILYPILFLLLTLQAAPAQVPTSRGSQTDKTILFLENQRFEGMIRKDSVLLHKILAEDLHYTHSSGKVDGRTGFISSITSGKTVYESIKPEGVQVRDYGNTAVVTGVAHVNVTTDGQPLDLQLRYTDVYVKRNGQWQMVLWQSTRIATPTPAPK